MVDANLSFQDSRPQYLGGTPSPQVSLKNLNREYGHLEAQELLLPLIKDVFLDNVAVSSSFGAESAILLHMVSQIDPATPILFIDTKKLFDETLAYRDRLVHKLGLKDVRIVRPSNKEILEQDADGKLWQTNPNACCAMRKVAPFEAALQEFSAIITGRKRFQSSTRQSIDVIEHDGTHFKINPVARWSVADIKAYMTDYDLPAHPLVAKGYLSIGCAPCTTPVKVGEDARAGRWRDASKTECGIHFTNGRIVRPSQNAA